MNDNPAPLAYGVLDACRRLGVGKNTLYTLMQAGELPAFKIGRKTMFTDADLSRFVALRSKSSPVRLARSVLP